MFEHTEQGEAIAKEARASLSPYCINTCKAQCCRKGRLTLYESELPLVIGDKVEPLLEKGLLVQQRHGTFHLDLGGIGGQCPKLTADNKCGIYDNPGKPAICTEFPLMIRPGFAVRGSPCPGIAEGLLDEYLEKLALLGYKII